MLRRAAIITGITAGLLTLLSPVGSSAAMHDRVVSEDPVDWTPDVLDGRVRGTATVGTTTVVVGDFTQVREQGSGDVFDRSDIFAFDAQGEIIGDSAPEVEGSEVFDVIDAGDGRSVYIAGSFRAVNGQTTAARVTRLDVESGEVIQSFDAPTFNNKATALDLVRPANGRPVLYVAGWFTQVGGRPRTLLTALNPRTGADLNTLDLTFSRTWNGGVLGAWEMTVRPDGSRLVVIGNFRRVDGQRRSQMAMVNLNGRRATLDRWSTQGFSSKCSPKHETYMWGLDTSPDGRYFVIGTTGGYAGGPAKGTLCDTVTRWEFRGHRPDRQPTWINYTGGDTVTDVEVTGAAVYAGGHFRWLNNPFGRDSAGPGAVPRKGLAALDPRNGLPLSWNPGRLRGWGVWGFASTDLGLWIGHDTAELGGETHERLAFMPLLPDEGLRSPDSTGTLPGEVFLLGRQDESGADDAVARRSFDGKAAGSLIPVPDGGVSWSEARGAFMADGTLYTAWADGRFDSRSFDGEQFGPPESLEHGLPSFAEELATMRTMWFDRATGRLYYTLKTAGNRLFYRYFTPESRTIGTLVHETSVGEFGFDKVNGTFLAQGKLWYRTRKGALGSVTWKKNKVLTRTAERVSGPSPTWGSQTLFLHAE